MSTWIILTLIGGLLVALAAAKSLKIRHVDLQSRIWFMTGAILLAVSAWLRGKP